MICMHVAGARLRVSSQRSTISISSGGSIVGVNVLKSHYPDNKRCDASQQAHKTGAMSVRAQVRALAPARPRARAPARRRAVAPSRPHALTPSRDAPA